MARAVTAHLRVKTTIPVGRKPFGVAADPRTKRIYVANFGSGTVSVISARTGTVVTTIRVGRVPIGSPRTRGPTPSTSPTRAARRCR